MSGYDMRIIAGVHKGMRLKTPKTQQIRPTSDRVREFIFSCLQMDVADAVVLDLFAGTGAFGIEALSRGAQDVVFVDNSRAAVELVKQNLDIAKCTASVVKSNALLFLKEAHSEFDLIFCDPPYAFENFQNILQQVVDNNLLAAEGQLIYETGSKHTPALYPGLMITRQKKMGDTHIIFYKRS